MKIFRFRQTILAICRFTHFPWRTISDKREHRLLIEELKKLY